MMSIATGCSPASSLRAVRRSGNGRCQTCASRGTMSGRQLSHGTFGGFGLGKRPIDPGPRGSQGEGVISELNSRRSSVVTTEPVNQVEAAAQVVRVLIADDQTLFRSGLARLLESDQRVQVVGQAMDGLDAVKRAAALKPDVILMDLKMPNLDGIEATRQILADHPEIKVLILTTFDADTHILQALRAGASGYVLKDSQPAAI